MGCMGSKQAGAALGDVAVYRPPPTSVSLFDISAVEEPWLIAKQNKDDGDEDDDDEQETDDDDDDEEEEVEDEKSKKLAMVPLPLLEKVEGFELAPASWSEVSKALEDMKPSLNSKTPPPPAAAVKKTKKKKKMKKKKKQEKPAAEPAETTTQKKEEEENNKVDGDPAPPELAGRRVVKDNPFLMRDREKNQQGGGEVVKKWKRRDPFEGCPERRPPGASGGGVVLYTTTLRGVRRTFEDCERVRELVESACADDDEAAVVDERDVSLHGEYLRELRELAGEAAPPPRLFVMGRYVGGAEECTRLAESGKLREMMRWAKARGEACNFKDGRGCVGCGGARFVPCWECGGSCKIVVLVDGNNVVERCPKCNENGLMMCPVCH
ncbi:hypothetical protein QOZ80_1BG0049620 [Eleusine coracana subsp. coracana]|nr:hypothetical protein QOZ80_1BG0049620 [Eleusine coracana subsp. coracana]